MGSSSSRRARNDGDRRGFRLGAAIAVSVSLASVLVGAQVSSGTGFEDAMYRHLKKAQEIAGQDLYPHFAHRCLIDQTYRRTISRSIQATGAIEPLQVLDNLYFVGQNAASSWAVRTSAGIVVIDTLNSAEEAKTYIVGGLQKLGLDPAQIKYVLITHAHADHFNGARFLQETYGATVWASKVDWDTMMGARGAGAADDGAAPARGRGARGGVTGARGGRGGSDPAGPPQSAARPVRGVDLADGQTLTIGDTRFTFHVTPGHTAGTVSTIFTATDRGARRVVGMFGGLGTPASAEDKKAHIASLTRFKGIAEKAGVDTLIANHQTQDLSLAKLELLRLRRAGDPNPYVVGRRQFLRYLDIQSECTAYAMARERQQ
jgi:metallo-beta-lactamase class B